MSKTHCKNFNLSGAKTQKIKKDFMTSKQKAFKLMNKKGDDKKHKTNH